MSGVDLIEFMKIAGPVASATFALTRLWDRWRRRRLAVRAGVFKAIDPITKTVLFHTLVWDVLGSEGLVENVNFEVVRPGARLERLRARLRRARYKLTLMQPPQLQGPAFPAALEGRASWWLPPEALLGYQAMAGMDAKFKLRPRAVVRRGTKTRVVRGKDIRPKLRTAPGGKVNAYPPHPDRTCRSRRSEAANGLLP